MAEDIEPVVDCHHYHIPAAAEHLSVISRLVAGAGGKAAAMEPDHHGALFPVPDARRPEVQILAVVVGALLAVSSAQSGDGALGRDGTVAVRFPDPFPRVCRNGGDKALLCLSIGNAQIPENTVCICTANESGSGSHNALLQNLLRGGGRSGRFRLRALLGRGGRLLSAGGQGQDHRSCHQDG